MSCESIEVHSNFKVDAHLQRWTITNDDIYLIRFHEAPPGWLDDIIQDVIDGTGLVDDLGDLDTRFENFQEGYLNHFYDWQDGDRDTLAFVENIYTTKGEFHAGIQDIKIAYVSRDESGAMFDRLIGAWQTGQGGAWFEEEVSTVSNVAYAAAKSASTLTATMLSQQDELRLIAGDVESLEKQIDGTIVTWKGTHDVINPDGTLVEDAKPYWCWIGGNECTEGIWDDIDNLAETRDYHTGDTYLKVENNALTGKEDLVAIYRFGKDSNTGMWNWFVVTDSLAASAYQQAIDAGILADGKINSFYQTYPPNAIEEPTLGEGDLWTDSDDKNKLWRYNGTKWIEIRDVDIKASVTRLDQATVTVGGIATAKSTLVVDAGGSVTGMRLSATNDPDDRGSKFRIYADEFTVAASNGQPSNVVPFRVDTRTRNIYFNGIVNFKNIEDDSGYQPGWLFAGDAAGDVNSHTTTINGGKITTNSLNANRIAVNTIWARGRIASNEFKNNTSGYVSGGKCGTGPNGFQLNANAGAGSWSYPSIYGGYIRGGIIAAAKVECAALYYNNKLMSGCPRGNNYGRSGFGGANYYHLLNSPATFTKYLSLGWLAGPCYGTGFNKARVLGKGSSLNIQMNASYYSEGRPGYTMQIQFGGYVLATSSSPHVGNTLEHASGGVAAVVTNFNDTDTWVKEVVIVLSAVKCIGDVQLWGSFTLTN